MKTLLLTAALVALVTTGCKTSDGGDPLITTGRVAAVSEMAAYTGTALRLESHPQDRPYFVASQQALGAILGSTNVSPSSLAEALRGLPIKELKGEQGALIVGNAVILYDAYLRENINLDANIYLRPVVSGIHSGLTRALDAKR